ncbi:glycerol kinase [Belliella baltica DSM 15883]|uniref:Glycerol kinase n=1 Tax=Belliella baltica (strain DSM 15883 / CIP 108006 / LMG 21964 / BA134) TaxID=866536 RepID=I3Z715_BELBD|nr:glycerol kinase GlpK [Belliella baltica]AFL85033.1 glycerol kinase [Belliella baltica DSM 15883]
MEKYVLAMDQGTTSSRSIIFDKSGNIISVAQKEFTQIFPKPGWVEHDPIEIWSTQAAVTAEATAKVGLNGKNLAAIGITNQRETVLVWEKKTGQPIYNAIVWQDKRTSDYCEKLKSDGKEKIVREKTGLVLDPYFSGTKIKWILDNVEGARERAQNGELVCGTIDTWLVWNLTKGETHVTDVSNASRTLLFNINTLQWDDELLQLFDIPKAILPEVKESSEIYGHTKTTIFASKIPISGIAGDQQAALFGQQCTQTGMVKNTYGTGCFMLMNIGDKPIISKNGLLTTVAWSINGKTQYALEGSIFIGGAVVQWLRDKLGVILSSKQVEELAGKVEDTEGVIFVPTFAGLGAPYWNSYARGTLFGLTRNTSDAHIARAALDAIAYQTMDVLHAMQADSGLKIRELRVDGGATVNNLLMQFQSDVMDTNVIRPKVTETTALGAAYLAGLAVGYWKNTEEISEFWVKDRVFEPNPDRSKVEVGIENWHHAIKTIQFWTNKDF